MRRNETGRTQSESRKRKTETVVEYETKKKAPPVVRQLNFFLKITSFVDPTIADFP